MHIPSRLPSPSVPGSPSCFGIARTRSPRASRIEDHDRYPKGLQRSSAREGGRALAADGGCSRPRAVDTVPKNGAAAPQRIPQFAVCMEYSDARGSGTRDSVRPEGRSNILCELRVIQIGHTAAGRSLGGSVSRFSAFVVLPRSLVGPRLRLGGVAVSDLHRSEGASAETTSSIHARQR